VIFPTPNLLIDGEISLKPLALADAGELYALTDTNRAHLRRWLPWLDMTTSVDGTRSFIETSIKEWEQKSALHLCVRYRNETAGVIGFHRFDWPNRTTSIGYWLSEPLQQGGIMTRSCRVLLSFAFDELNLNRAEIRCAVFNHRSRAIPERLGFAKEGIIRDGEWLYDRFVDLVVYEMHAKEWRKPLGS
jgi:ribosomal-protein-serine acetyltransferase